jgi:hypothetical protein
VGGVGLVSGCVREIFEVLASDNLGTSLDSFGKHKTRVKSISEHVRIFLFLTVLVVFLHFKDDVCVSLFDHAVFMLLILAKFDDFVSFDAVFHLEDVVF